MPDDTPFLDEIYARPDDPAAYLVYADVLQARSDPRGELIVLQHAGHDASAYLAKHPELALPTATIPFKLSTPLQPDSIEWFCGFVKSLDAFRFVESDVEALITHPSARFIRKLSISGTGGLSGGSVVPLAAAHLARTLEAIDVHPNATGIIDRDYIDLAPCKHLRSIHMSGMDEESVSIAAFHALRAFPLLESVSAPMTLTDAACAAFVGLPIKQLFFYLADLTDVGVADLAKLPLHSVELDGSIAPSIAPLAHHPTLTDLTLSSNYGRAEITPSVARVLATLPALVRLNLHNSWLEDAGVAELAPLAPRLRSLALGNTPITNAACATLARMRALDFLDAGVSAPGLRQLAPLTELECLRVHSPDLDDDGIRELRPFTKLARLSIGGPNRITDACIEHLAALPQLALLNLTRTAITAGGIDRLSRLPKLRTLCVASCDPTTIARAQQIIGHWEVTDFAEGFDDSRDLP